MMGGYHQVILPSDTDMIGNEGWDTSYISVWDTGGNCLCPQSLLSNISP